MKVKEHLSNLSETVAYRMKWLVLNLWGPADLPEENDPMDRLKREYHREEEMTPPRNQIPQSQSAPKPPSIEGSEHDDR